MTIWKTNCRRGRGKQRNYNELYEAVTWRNIINKIDSKQEARTLKSQLLCHFTWYTMIVSSLFKCSRNYICWNIILFKNSLYISWLFWISLLTCRKIFHPYFFVYQCSQTHIKSVMLSYTFIDLHAETAINYTNNECIITWVQQTWSSSSYYNYHHYIDCIN